MASESALCGTITLAFLVSPSRTTRTTLAGLKALAMNVSSSSDQGTTSIFSPFNSFTMFCMRTPRIPTQEPTGSTPGCSAATATLDRDPASRAMALISTVPL